MVFRCFIFVKQDTLNNFFLSELFGLQFSVFKTLLHYPFSTDSARLITSSQGCSRLQSLLTTIVSYPAESRYVLSGHFGFLFKKNKTYRQELGNSCQSDVEKR